MPPKLNLYGRPECRINNAKAHCDFMEDHMLRLYIPFPLFANQSFVVEINGVLQPVYLRDIIQHIAMDVDEDYYNGVAEDCEYRDVAAKKISDTSNL